MYFDKNCLTKRVVSFTNDVCKPANRLADGLIIYGRVARCPHGETNQWNGVETLLTSADCVNPTAGTRTHVSPVVMSRVLLRTNTVAHGNCTVFANLGHILKKKKAKWFNEIMTVMINSLWNEQVRGWMVEKKGAFHMSLCLLTNLNDVWAV